MNKTALTVNRIEPMTFAKLMATLYVLIGLIIGSFVSLTALIGTGIGVRSEVSPVFGLAMGAAAVIVIPLLYGTLGFLGSLIVAGLYNWLAGFVGGVTFLVTLSGPQPPAAAPEPFRPAV